MSECSNRHNHVSAFPGYGRAPCQVCGQAYVKTTERIVKEALEKGQAPRW